ncbi:zf-HC2 domain-containing protein [bacterium]|nr:zf-HC2 domain-containing protein [bacterium]
MTDLRETASGGGAPCPDFEVLSCFADGELSGPTAAEVTAHLGACPRCEAVTSRLREGFGAGEAGFGGGLGGSGCASEEQLVLYVSGALGGSDRAPIAAHVGGCDPCVASLAQLHRRLSVLGDVAAPIPADVVRRAQAVLPAALAELAPAAVPTAAGARPHPALAREAGPSLLERLRAWLRVPVLAPLAVAATALFMVAVGSLPSTGPDGGERSRALPPSTVRLRVTADSTTMYSRPSGKSDPLGTVGRGATVAVAGEERGWYEVRLDDGRSGWILREAFE